MQTNYFESIFSHVIRKAVISKPAANAAYRRIDVLQKDGYLQLSQYTDKQVFHKNLSAEQLQVLCEQELLGQYRQFDFWTEEKEFHLMVSKKGKITLSSRTAAPAAKQEVAHNRQKNYLLKEGEIIPPLVDMGIFTAEGKVVASMYDKFRQINRLIEMIDDAAKELDGETVHILDFGCGKSYLTFIVYYYFTEIRHIPVEIVGLDLKADVIEKCNLAAQKYGYDHLHFELGDVNGYKAPFPVDMVLTLHARDTATDYALFNAVQWNARMIFSVPCCQHELNAQMQSEELALFTRYGIIKERFAALTTDAIRGNLLTCCGYKTQLLEFIDFAHTPKNILIRAVKGKIIPNAVKSKALREVEAAMQEFHLNPTLYRLLSENHLLD